jgi:hypothetical protein
MLPFLALTAAAVPAQAAEPLEGVQLRGITAAVGTAYAAPAGELAPGVRLSSVVSDAWPIRIDPPDGIGGRRPGCAATTIAGSARLERPVDPRRLPRIDLVVAGSVAVNPRAAGPPRMAERMPAQRTPGVSAGNSRITQPCHLSCSFRAPAAARRSGGPSPRGWAISAQLTWSATPASARSLPILA